MGGRVGLKVAAFAVAMVLVAAGLVVTFGRFSFAPTQSYRAEFASVSRLVTGQDVRIAGVPVGSVTAIDIDGDHVDVEFNLQSRFRVYDTTQAAIRYEDLVGNRYLEITGSPGTQQVLAPGSTIGLANTRPALDLDALLGGLKPVLQGLDGRQLNEIGNAVISLLQGQGGALAQVLADTGSFTRTLSDRDQLIGDVIVNLNDTLAVADARSAELDTSLDQLQQLITTLSDGRDPIAGALGPLASAQTELTETLEASRRPLQGIVEEVVPLATALNDRQDEINSVLDETPQAAARFTSLGAYGSFFNIFFCAITFKINGPNKSDILIPAVSPINPSRGRCAFADE